MEHVDEDQNRHCGIDTLASTLTSGIGILTQTSYETDKRRPLQAINWGSSVFDTTNEVHHDGIEGKKRCRGGYWGLKNGYKYVIRKGVG